MTGVHTPAGGLWMSTSLRVKFNGYRAEPPQLHLRAFRRYGDFDVKVTDIAAMAEYAQIPAGAEIEVGIFALLNTETGEIREAELRRLWAVDDTDGPGARKLWSEWLGMGRLLELIGQEPPPNVGYSQIVAVVDTMRPRLLGNRPAFRDREIARGTGLDLCTVQAVIHFLVETGALEPEIITYCTEGHRLVTETNQDGVYCDACAEFDEDHDGQVSIGQVHTTYIPTPLLRDLARQFAPSRS